MLRFLNHYIATGQSKKWQLPLLISLPNYWLACRRDHKLSLLTFAVRQHLDFNESETHDQSTAIEEKQLKKLLRLLSGSHKQHLLFLLDGFDELSDNTEAVQRISTEIQRLSKHFSWLTTTRNTGFYGRLNEDQRFELIGLDSRNYKKLVHNWFQLNQPTPTDQKAQQLINQIQNSSSLTALAKNPFLLSLLCHASECNQAPLPIQRIQSYALILKLMREQTINQSLTQDQFGPAEYAFLKNFSFFQHSKKTDNAQRSFNEDHWYESSAPKLPPSFNRVFLPTRLFSKWAQGDFHFSHLAFQDYLTAQHLSALPFDTIKPLLLKPSFWNACRFLAGIYWQKNQQQHYQQLLAFYASQQDEFDVINLKIGWLLIEAGLEDAAGLLGWSVQEKLQTRIKDPSLSFDAISQISKVLVSLQAGERVWQPYSQKVQLAFLQWLPIQASQETLVALLFQNSLEEETEVALLKLLKKKADTETLRLIDQQIETNPLSEKLFQRLTTLALQLDAAHLKRRLKRIKKEQYVTLEKQQTSAEKPPLRTLTNHQLLCWVLNKKQSEKNRIAALKKLQKHPLPPATIDALITLLNRQIKQPTPLLNQLIMTLVQTAPSRLGDYVHHVHFHQALKNLAISKQIIIFPDGFINQDGQKTSWLPQHNLNWLDQTLTTSEQNEHLRQTCLGLLASQKAKQSGKYIKGQYPKPLFKPDDLNESNMIGKSISRKTGKKLLKGEEIERISISALLDWLKEAFKDDIKWKTT